MDRELILLLNILRDALPPILYRNNPRFIELVGLSPSTMRRIDASGEGPKKKVKNGKIVGYPRASLVDWLGTRIKKYSKKKPNSYIESRRKNE